MKVEQPRQFSPVTIVIETKEELVALRHALSRSLQLNTPWIDSSYPSLMDHFHHQISNPHVIS